MLLGERLSLKQNETRRRRRIDGTIGMRCQVVERQGAIAVFVVQGQHHRAVDDLHRQGHRLLRPFVPKGLIRAFLSIETHHEEIQGVGSFFVAVVDEKEGSISAVAVGIEVFEFLGQGDEVATGLVKAAVETCEVP